MKMTMTEQEAVTATHAKYPSVLGYAIENVAGWNGSKFQNAMNLAQDAECYGWRGKKLMAVKMVLRLQGKL